MTGAFDAEPSERIAVPFKLGDCCRKPLLGEGFKVFRDTE